MLLQSPLRNGDHPEEKIMDPVMMTMINDDDTFFIMIPIYDVDDVNKMDGDQAQEEPTETRLRKRPLIICE